MRQSSLNSFEQYTKMTRKEQFLKRRGDYPCVRIDPGVQA